MREIQAMTEIQWGAEAREAVHDRLGCEKTYSERDGYHYCLRHHVGWLHDVNGCPHVDAALRALAPYIEAMLNEARSEVTA